MNQKGGRGANFTESSRFLLVKLCNKYKKIIECKKTDGTSWRDKANAWQQICQEFNSSCEGAVSICTSR